MNQYVQLKIQKVGIMHVNSVNTFKRCGQIQVSAKYVFLQIRKGKQHALTHIDHSPMFSYCRPYNCEMGMNLSLKMLTMDSLISVIVYESDTKQFVNLFFFLN